MRVDRLGSQKVWKMAETAEVVSAMGSLKADLTETMCGCEEIAKGTAEGSMEFNSV